MNILGIGIVFSGGRGIDCFENALRAGWQRPSEVETPFLTEKKSFAYHVDPQTMSDKTLFKKMRRADKLSKMAVLAAADSLADSGIENITPSLHPSPSRVEGAKTGVIVATAFGAHATTFDFLNDILDYGEANVSPTTFSNSVHNAAASYVSSVLDIQGPTLTVTQFFFSFHCAFQLAQAWLNEKRCDYVLVGAVEQYGDVLGYIYDSKLTRAADGRIMPFNFKPAFQVPGEGAVFFLVSNKRPVDAYCEVQNVSVNIEGQDLQKADLNIIDTDGLLEDETIYKRSLSPAVLSAAYSPLFGSMMIGSAFNCAAGALMLKKQTIFANPVKDNPHRLNIAVDTTGTNIELIRCTRYNCSHEKAVICLNKI